MVRLGNEQEKDMKGNGSAAVTGIGPDATNGAKEIVEFSQPYVVDVKIEGTADLLFHRWNCEAVAEKAAAAKGSKAKKSDNIESYVYRNDDGELCLRQSILHAAKFRQDPRSPRKSAMDLYKAGVISLTIAAPLGAKTWDYEHKCRVMIQRNGVTRVRPAFKVGWGCSVQLMVNLPEYIKPNDLHDVCVNAGRLIGVGDFRPTYGRFCVKSFDVGLE
jgi:hypothetical protein